VYEVATYSDAFRLLHSIGGYPEHRSSINDSR
jgi:hypothetical protein